MTRQPPEARDDEASPDGTSRDEASLEPVELIRRSGTVLRIGRLALSAGTGSYRVKSHMWRAGRALGLDRVAAHVTLTEITATSYRGPIFRTELTEVRSIGIDADRLSELERFSSALPAVADLGTVDAELDRIARKPPLYGALLNATWAGVACSAFAFLNNGGAVECGAVLVAAALGQGVRRAMLHRGINQFGVTMLAAAVASIAYLVVVLALSDLAGVTGNHEAGYVSAVLFLVPGFALVTGALDLARLDFSAGVARLTYALMILASAALAVWGVSALAGLAPDPVPPPGLSEPVLVALRTLASFLGVLGFALMFNSPWSMALGAAAIGTVANVGRLLLVDGGVVPQAAAAAAALLVGLLAATLAPALRVPRITVSVPAVVIMVPGVTAYRAVYEFNTGATTQALAYAVEAGLVIVALAIGLAVARMLTDRRWTFEQ
ncbi:threonine/serine exporter family protein [Cellulosimicrobium sp. PMB13]|uniref:threonine/serine ThrE exporter family protein n=1 Tax=Cellulosimicrobium sp. PMB13 TaxID=3120158 RepID=UPI003F4B2AE4